VGKIPLLSLANIERTQTQTRTHMQHAALWRELERRYGITADGALDAWKTLSPYAMFADCVMRLHVHDITCDNERVYSILITYGHNTDWCDGLWLPHEVRWHEPADEHKPHMLTISAKTKHSWTLRADAEGVLIVPPVFIRMGRAVLRYSGPRSDRIVTERVTVRVK